MTPCARGADPLKIRTASVVALGLRRLQEYVEFSFHPLSFGRLVTGCFIDD